MKYKCVIFDCDGVLVDSEKISNDVLKEMATELGVNIAENEILENFSGMNLKLVLNHIQKRFKKNLPPDFESDYRIRSYQKFKVELKPIEGIFDLIRSLSVPICVASSGPPEKIKQNLKTTKLIKYFNGNLFSAYDIKKWKPKPDIFLHAAKKMGFPTSDCAVVEDSLAGVTAGIHGGFDVYAYCNKSNETIFSEAGAICFNHMSELQKLWA